METPFGVEIRRKKLKTVRKTLLDHLWNLIALLKDSEDHCALFKQFQREINHLRKDLRSWPSFHEIKMAIRRLDDINCVADEALKQMDKPKGSHSWPFYAVIDIKIRIKASYIK